MAIGRIFDTVAELQTVVGNQIVHSFELLGFAPFIDIAYHEHMEEWLPPALWDKIVAEYPNDIDGLGNLYPYVQRALAPLALYEYQPTAGIEWGGAGPMRVETEERKSLFKYQENRQRTNNLQNGYRGIELMVDFLQKNADDYPDWTGSDAAALSRSLVINTAREFRSVHTKKVGRYILNSMRTEISEAEQFILPANLGWEFYTEYKEKIAATETTGVWKPLHRHAQSVIAHAAMRMAVRRNIVKYDGEKVIKVETLEPQGYEREGAGTATEVGSLLRHLDEFSNRHLSLLLHYLDKNIEETAFLKYKTWKTARIEAAETEAEKEAKRDYPCGCYDKCTCRAEEPNKSVFRI